MGLQIIGIGMVTENKPSGEYYVDVFIPSQSMLASNELNSKEKKTLSIKLSNQLTKQLAVDENFKVKAKWLKIGDSNRITPPELSMNQHVLVIQEEGYDEYFWVKVFEELDNTRQESVTYAWGNQPDNLNDPASYLENAYRFSVDTHEGEVRFLTTKANQEQAVYSVMFDTKNGTFALEDDLDNAVRLDSVQGKLKTQVIKDFTLKTGENQNTLILKNSNTQIEGQQNLQLKGPLTIVAKDKVSQSITGDYQLESQANCNLKIVHDLQAKTLGGLKIQTNQDAHLVSNAGKVQVVSSTEVTVVAPIINLIGVVNTGVLNCSALNMGSPPPPPPPITLPQMESIDLSPVEEAIKTIQEETEEKESTESNSSDSSNQKDPWSEESTPPEPEKPSNPSQSVSTMEKEAIMKADQGMTITSNAKIILDSKQTAKVTGNSTMIEGKSSMKIQGVTGDLMDLLEDIIGELARAGEVPQATTSSAGPGTTVPDGRWTQALAAIKMKLQAWKGS